MCQPHLHISSWWFLRIIWRKKRLGSTDLPLKLPKGTNLGPEEEEREQAVDNTRGETQAGDEHEDKGHKVARAPPHGDEAADPDEHGGVEVDAPPEALADLAGHVPVRHGEDFVVVGEG